MVHVLLSRSDDAPVMNEVFNEFLPNVEPPRFMARISVDRPGLLISIAVIAVID